MAPKPIPKQMVVSSYTSRMRDAGDHFGILIMTRVIGRFRFGASRHYWFFTDTLTDEGSVRSIKDHKSILGWKP